MTGHIPTHLSFFENTLPHHAQTQGNPLHDMTVSCHKKIAPDSGMMKREYPHLHLTVDVLGLEAHASMRVL